jgi:spore coat polysaccharide biosynthesis protein SpsF
MFIDIPVLVQARTGSKRFPQKILKPWTNRQSVLWNVYSQCKKASNNVFVIGIEQDRMLIEHCREYGINMIPLKVPENDLIQRYAVACAQLGATGFLRVTADCPLVFPQEIVWVGLTALKGRYDFVTNNPPGYRTTPDGTDCEYYSSALINWMAYNVKDEHHREHLPLFMYEAPASDKRIEGFRLGETNWPANMSGVKFSIDTPEEYEKIKAGETL